VIAALPRGEYGTNRAATVASHLLRTFTNVRIALMVGIGGGAPLIEVGEARKQDVRLGDVVVSTPSQGWGGVCQYDFGKAIQEREFKLTGHLNQPPDALLTAITVLSGDFEVNGHEIDKGISAILEKRPKLCKKYQRPPMSSDRLYKSSFIRDEIASTKGNNEDQIVQRKSREDEENVMIHYGLIASGNSLVKDATMRNALARKLGILCFEMEAAGLMNQYPFLVIRGICDYCDTHKNDDWHGYAAMTAAMYARKLLLRVAPNKVEAEARLNDLGSIKQDLQHGMYIHSDPCRDNSHKLQ
jgi:nucleoside phosphorylase